MAQPRISFGFTSADLNLDATSSSGTIGQAQLQSMKKSRVSKVRARKRLPSAHGDSASNTSSGSDYDDCALPTRLTLIAHLRPSPASALSLVFLPIWED